MLFWQKQPALLIGLHLLIATAAAIEWNWVYLIPLALFWTPLFRDGYQKIFLGQLIGAICLGGVIFFHAKINLPQETPKQEQIEGLAYFSPDTVQIQQSPFQRSYAYKGIVRHFEGLNGETFSSLPCQIFLPLNAKRPSADVDYLIIGKLCKSPHGFHFKPQKKLAWRKINSTFSLAELRHLSKQKIRAYLKNVISDEKSASFLSALATGEIDERLLTLEFGRIGMQHILAISGFHFALLAAFFCVILRLFFRSKASDLITLVLLSIYFIFIGNSPSVLRAWTAIAVFLLGRMINLRCSALNALGMGLIVEILSDPNVVTNLAFQLSFLCTLAILIGYPILNNFLAALLPMRTLDAVKKMPIIDQLGAILSTLLRNALAIGCAVHIFAVPLVLFLFHKFPLLSFLYNLVFPPLIGLSFLLLCLASTVAFLPFLAQLLHSCNSFYSSFLLDLCSNPPATLEFILRTSQFPFSLLIGILSLLFFGAVALTKSEIKS